MSDNQARYEIWYSDPQGNRINLFDNLCAMTLVRTVNEPGMVEIVMPGDFDTSLLGQDNMIEVWRQPAGSALYLEAVFFTRAWAVYDDQDDTRYVSIGGVGPLDLLRRRVAAYYAASVQANMTDQIDDMLKAIVKDNLGSDAGTDYDGNPVTGRDMSAYNLTIQADASACASITKGFAWRKLSDLFAELAANSQQQGLNLYYDFVPVVQSDGSIGFEFQTFTGQRGEDRSWASGGAMLFGPEFGNLTSPSLRYDFSQEITHVYTGGQGIEEGRNIQEVSDGDRTGASIWNRCEEFGDARNESSDAGVISAGRSILDQGKPVVTFEGTLLDTTYSAYGRDWNFGDLVSISYARYQFDAVVKGISITLDADGNELVQGYAELAGGTGGIGVIT